MIPKSTFYRTGYLAAASCLAAGLATAELAVEGRVMAAGRPVAGAEAQMYRIADELETSFQRAAGAARREPVASAATDAGGRFRLSAPGPGLFEVTVEVPEPGPWAYLVPLVEAVELPALELSPAAEPAAEWTGTITGWRIAEPRPSEPAGGPVRQVSGRVTDERTGRPLAGALVWAWSGSSGTSGFTDAAGGFELAAAAPVLLLGAVAAGYGPAELRWSADDPSGAAPETAIALAPLRMGVGRVVDERGRPIEGAEVRLVAAGIALEHRTDAEGRYRAPGLPAGRYDLQAAADGYAPVEIPGLSVAPVAGEIDLGVVTLPAAGQLVGRVVDSQDRPLSGAVARLTVERGLPGEVRLQMAGAAVTVTTDGDGQFEILDLPAERFHLRLEAEGYRSVSRSIAVTPAGRSVEIVLEPVATVAGWVLDGQGQPVAGALVTAAADPLSGRSTTTTANGRFEISDAPPGRLDLVASAAGFREARLSELELSPGEELTGVEIVLERGAAVAGIVRRFGGDPAAGAGVELAGPGSPADVLAFTRADEQGRFGFSELEPGRYRLMAQDAAGRRAVREVAAAAEPAEVELVLEGGLELAGSVIHETGEPVARAAVTLLDRSSGRPARETQTDGLGRFAFPDSPPGTYLVLASVEGLAPAYGGPVEVAEAPVPEVVIELGPGVTLRGRVAGLVGSEAARVVVRARTFAGDSVTGVDSEGRFFFRHLPPGELALSAQIPGSARRAWERLLLPEGAGEIAVDLVLAEEP